MKLPTRFIALLLGGVLLTYSLALAQGKDERSFESQYRQGQFYENLKDYRKAIAAYRQAQSNATPEASKNIDKKIGKLDDLLLAQQLINEGLASEIEKKINQLTSLSNRKQFLKELEKLQQRDDATSANYQQLMRQVELEGNNSEGVVESSVTPTPQRSTQAHHASAKSTDPPPKKVTSSMPIYTPKAASDFKTTKSAGSLLNNSGKPKQ